MIDRWIVFGGWAVSPAILAPLFGQDAAFIDTNELMPHLVRDNTLVPHWQDLLADRLSSHMPEPLFGIAGWSTGAMLAFAVARHFTPARGVFLSATPSFCRRTGFPYGRKSSILRRMREQLASDTKQVLEEFYARCGLDNKIDARIAISSYDRSTLIAGLRFLEQATLFPVNKLPCPSLFLHGRSDAIIPMAAGKKLCLDAGGSFAEVDGAHAFFINQYAKISELINLRFF